MRSLQRPPFSSGQGSNPSFARTQLQAGGTLVRAPQQRFVQPGDPYQNSNTMIQQQVSRMPTTAQQAFTSQPS